eukprot:UN17672
MTEVMFCLLILLLLDCYMDYTLNSYTTHTTHTQILPPRKSCFQNTNEHLIQPERSTYLE